MSVLPTDGMASFRIASYNGRAAHGLYTVPVVTGRASGAVGAFSFEEWPTDHETGDARRSMLKKLLARINGARVLVVGDAMLDR
ncbi:MAG: hypothetical protein ACYDDA_15955, partial [Acidiferrobacteraceae bacterium]